MNNKYILDEKGNPKSEPDILKWSKWFETAERHIGDDKIDGVKISTVFLGLDHNFGEGKPILWETMIFGGKHNDYQKRYTSKKSALNGHKKAIKMVRKDLKL